MSLKNQEERQMTEKMYFYIVRGHNKGEARVIREFSEEPIEKMDRPSGTLYELKREMDLGDLDAWDKVNQLLARKAKELGIHTLHNLYPSEDILKAVKIGAKIRARANS